MTPRQIETLHLAGYCAADAGVPFDFRQPEPWQQGWMKWSQNQIADSLRRTFKAPKAGSGSDAGRT